MNKNKHILIIGVGRIGKRHAKNLIELGCSISIFDPRKDRLDDAKKEFDVIESFRSFDKAINISNYDGAVICSPTKFHIEQAIQILKLEKIKCERFTRLPNEQMNM